MNSAKTASLIIGLVFTIGAAAEPFPDLQMKYMEIVSTYRMKYREGGDLKQQIAIRDRTAALKKVSPRTVELFIPIRGFVGEVVSVGVDNDGNALLVVASAEKEKKQFIGFTGVSTNYTQTFNPITGKYVDMPVSIPTTITPESPLYDVIADLSKGQKVKFDGRLRWGYKYILTPANSIEENMELPIFDIEYTKIDVL